MNPAAYDLFLAGSIFICIALVLPYVDALGKE